MGTIKINNQSISKLYLGNIAVKRAYSNGSIVYDTGVKPTPKPCFEVVREISMASGNYVDVYGLITSKWYKKNNLSQYEEYGVMPIVDDLSTLTTYVGKLVLLESDEHEYRWDGNTWVDLGRAGTWTYKYWLNSISSAPEFNINYNWGTGYKAVLDFYLNSSTSLIGGNIVFKNVNTSVFMIKNGGYALNVETYKPASDQDNTVKDASTNKGDINTSSPLFYTDREHLLIIKNDSIETYNIDGSLIGKKGTDQNITGWYNGFYESIIRPYYSDSYAKYKVGYLKIYDNNDNLIHDIQLKMNRNLSESRKISYYDHVTGTEYTNTTNNNIDYDEIINDIDIVVDYDKKVAPANNVHYNTLSELELMECPWVGMKATIGSNNDPYIYTANGWVIYTPTYNDQYLTIESLVDNNEIRWKHDSISRQIYYSLDGNNWSSAFSDTSGTLLATLNTGDKLYLKGDHIKGSHNDRCFFSISGEYNLSGNILSLIYMDDFYEKYSIQSTECFYGTFSDTPIVSAENLVIPINNVPNSGLRKLFSNCKSLVSADISFISSVEPYGMYDMFSGCTNLKYIKLPSSTLTLSNYAMWYCFDGCSSLETNIILSVNDVYDYMCANMFYGCTSLKEITINITNQIVSRKESFSGMFQGCTSLKKATINYYYNLPPANYNYQKIFGNMFYGCSSLSYIKAMFLTLPTSYYNQTKNWVNGVSASGTFVKNVNATWNVTGNDGVPAGWTIETANP